MFILKLNFVYTPMLYYCVRLSLLKAQLLWLFI